MIYSKACEYAIRASIYIAHQSLGGTRSNLKSISKKIDSPLAFTAKILQQLVRHQIIQSVKGATGGFEIPKEKLKNIKLIDIVFAIDGENYDKMCVLGLKKCSEVKPCPVHNKFKPIKKDLIDMMRHTDLLEMSTGVYDGSAFLKL